MRILICSDCPPVPPLNGARLVLVALLRELQLRHDVRVVCLASPGEARDCDPATTMAVILKKRPLERPLDLLRATVTGRPLRVDRLATALAEPLAENLVHFKPDVVHVMGGDLAQLGRNLRGYPSILVPLDAEHLNWDAQALEERGLRRRLV